MRKRHFNLVRATEAAAIAAADWVGRGDKETVDKVASEAIANHFTNAGFSAQIAIAEGKKDNSYWFAPEGILGNPLIDPEYEVAIDPVEGTTQTAKGGYEAISCLALGAKGCFYRTDVHYMRKIAVGPEVGKCVDLRISMEDNVRAVAKALGITQDKVTVCVLDRPRHDQIVSELRRTGCCIKFISDCDVPACLATCFPDTGIDMYVSIGGAPEAIITAAAMKCLGGYFQCQESNGTSFFEAPAEKSPFLEIEDLAKDQVMFAATGITDGRLLKGVRNTARGPITHSLVMDYPSCSVLKIETQHGNQRSS